MTRVGLALLLVVIATAPFWVWNPYHLHTLIMAGIFAVLALSLNLLLGYTGQLSLGHAAFFGSLAVPVGKAVAAEPGEVHQVDVLHVGALLQEVFAQAAEHRRLEMEGVEVAIGHGGSGPTRREPAVRADGLAVE